MKTAFPLVDGKGEFDFYFKIFPWEIGLQSTCPADLKRKIAAVVISEKLGLRSLDYVIKNYLSNVTYSEEDSKRLDHRIRSFVSNKMSEFEAAIRILAPLPNKTLCRTVSEWTLSRAPFSMELLAHCGQRGALFEALAIARMMFEQLAWAYAINAEIEDDAVRDLSASRAITSLKSEICFAGKLYGWLSNHVHWAFDGHKKSMISRGEGEIGHCLASSYFKALIFSVMILFSKLYIDVIWALYGEILHLYPTHGIKPYDKSALTAECVSLLTEIRHYDEHDADLNLLSSMLKE